MAREQMSGHLVKDHFGYAVEPVNGYAGDGSVSELSPKLVPVKGPDEAWVTAGRLAARMWVEANHPCLNGTNGKYVNREDKLRPIGKANALDEQRLVETQGTQQVGFQEVPVSPKR